MVTIVNKELVIGQKYIMIKEGPSGIYSNNLYEDKSNNDFFWVNGDWDNDGYVYLKFGLFLIDIYANKGLYGDNIKTFISYDDFMDSMHKYTEIDTEEFYIDSQTKTKWKLKMELNFLDKEIVIVESINDNSIYLKVFAKKDGTIIK